MLALVKWLHFLRADVFSQAEQDEGDQQDERVPLGTKAPMSRKRKARVLREERAKVTAPRQSEFGRFGPSQRLNVDQVPFVLDNNARRAFVQAGDELCQVSGQPGADKRFGTLQIAIHPGDLPQPRLTIIFCGAGHVKAKEEKSYNPDVVVIFQHKAWADLLAITSWAQECLQPWAIEHLGEKPFLLFQDHLGCQKKAGYVQAVEKVGGQCVYGPRNKTQVWQPIDAGHIGAIVKAIGKDLRRRKRNTPKHETETTFS
jgi:hypothetical protein